MSSIKSEINKKNTISKAEIKFMEAFERLKINKPEIVPKGTPVSQNNVAKEAGVDPSALRSSRYPVITKSIKTWIAENSNKSHQKSQRQKNIIQRSRNKDLKEQIRDLKEQRDNALSKILDAQRQIVELTRENKSLRLRLPPINTIKLLD